MTQHDPFHEMVERMNEMIQEVSGDLSQTGTGLPVDIQETPETVIVRADMHGISKDNIQLKLRDNSLHIAAETDKELHEQGKDCFREERSRKQYSRRVQLPTPVEEGSASASYDDGVLTVDIRKVMTDIDIE